MDVPFGQIPMMSARSNDVLLTLLSYVMMC